MLSKVLTRKSLSESIEEMKKGLGPTTEIERQIKAEQQKLEDLQLAIQRNLNTIERTGSPVAQERLQQREAEKAQTKATQENLQLRLVTAWRVQFEKPQKTGTVRDIKAWLMQFVARMDLGYTRARSFYKYPTIDLLTSAARNVGVSLRGSVPNHILPKNQGKIQYKMINYSRI